MKTMSTTTKSKSRTEQTLFSLPDYDKTFLHTSTVQAKGGKTVYIRPEHHARMIRIINTIGQRKLSITDYLDNVLTRHFNEFEKEINKSFIENYSPFVKQKG